MTSFVGLRDPPQIWSAIRSNLISNIFVRAEPSLVGGRIWRYNVIVNNEGGEETINCLVVFIRWIWKCSHWPEVLWVPCWQEHYTDQHCNIISKNIYIIFYYFIKKYRSDIIKMFSNFPRRFSEDRWEEVDWYGWLTWRE